MALGLVIVVAAALWLSTRPSLSVKSRIQRSVYSAKAGSLQESGLAEPAPGRPKAENREPREQIAELHQRLIEYIQKTTQYFSILQDRLDEIQINTSHTNDQYSSRFNKIETKMTQISDELDKLYTIINVNKERSLKTFEKYLCELCSNAIGQRGKNNDYNFVVCNMNMKKFPSNKKCPEFKLEEGIEE